MAGKSDPSQNECKEIPLREESEEAARMLQQQRQREAYGTKGRRPTRQSRYNLRSASPLATGRLEASIGCTEEEDRSQLQPATRTRTHAQTDSTGQNTVATTRELLPLTSPLVDYDTESQEVVEVLPSEGDRVRKRSPKARLTAGHSSRAYDSQAQLPLSSSDTAEEQGGDHDRDWKYPPRAKKGGHHPGKRGK